jgi:hypothetical protein
VSSSSPAGGRPYRVEFSGDLLDRARELGRQATRQGRGQEFAAALRRVIDRLETDPAGWGEPVFRLRHLGLTVYRAADIPLHVGYGLDPQQHIVYVQALELMSQARPDFEENGDRNGQPPSPPS